VSISGANLAKILVDILDKSGLRKKVFAIVTDNAANNDTLFESLSDENVDVKQFRCFGHILNLVAQCALGEIGDSVAPVRELVKSVRNSPHKLDALNSICRTYDFPKLQPISDVSTRWNSTYFMIERSIELRQVRCFIESFRRIVSENHK
jgi:zinc finger BED domain-containing protein 1 (E3 SUMO-protein ligase ZBED1)